VSGIWLTEADVRSLVSVADAIPVLRQAFRDLGEGEADLLPRWRGHGPAGQGSFNVMAASLRRQGVCGLKAYPIRPGSGAWNLLLYTWDPVRLVAVMEADWLGRIRTGAASGLATDLLAAPDASTLALLGTGRQARPQAEAVCAVRPIREIRVWGRDPGRRQRAAAEIAAATGVPCRAVADAAEAVTGAAVVCTVTASASPLFDGDLLAPGAHVNAAGSNAADRAEIDARTVGRAACIVTDSVAGARHECGDLIQARVDWARVRDLGELVAGRCPGRTGADEITLFESQGVALEDVALARLVWQRAVARGAGTPLPA
jgi:alanine dehydrogenase